MQGQSDVFGFRELLVLQTQKGRCTLNIQVIQ